MKTISYTTARNNFAGTINTVCDDHAPIVITRQNHDDAVLMSLEDYNAWQETLYLMSSPQNAQRLMESLAQSQDSTLKCHKLKDEDD